MLLFKPYPRNKKRSAAIWLLEQIVKKKSTRITEFSDINYKQERSQINRRVYDVYTFQELSLLTKKYTQFDLRTALELLLQRKHIEIVNQNNSDLYDCSLQALWEGHAALIEETYNDEIETYRNDKYYSYSRWLLPIAAIVISIIALSRSIHKISYENNIQLQQPSPARK